MVWSIDSETGVLTDVLLCPPDHYQWIETNAIAVETLGSGRQIDTQRLHSQFRQLEEALDQAGVRRHYIEPEPHLHYQVYTRDSSQTTPWGPALTQLALPGADAAKPPRSCGFTGLKTASGDIAAAAPSRAATSISSGLDYCSSAGRACAPPGKARCNLPAGSRRRAGKCGLNPSPNISFISMSCSAWRAKGSPSPASKCSAIDFADWLKAHGIRVIEASYREVMAMSCNLLALGGDRVISPRHSARINAALRAEGVKVYDPELDLFAAGGGSVHCMTMPLRRAPL